MRINALRFGWGSSMSDSSQPRSDSIYESKELPVDDIHFSPSLLHKSGSYN